MIEFYGGKQFGNPVKPVCMPKDMWQMSLRILSAIGSEVEKRTSALNKCWDLCQRNYTTFQTSTETLDLSALEELDRSSVKYFENFKVAVLRISFKSFKFQRTQIYQESFLEMIAKIGGFSGLLMGASIISLFEFVCFILVLLVRLCPGGKHWRLIRKTREDCLSLPWLAILLLKKVKMDSWWDLGQLLDSKLEKRTQKKIWKCQAINFYAWIFFLFWVTLYK